MKKSKFTAPLVVRCEDAVSSGAFIDEVLRLPVDDSADGVRWDKVATIESTLTDGTYSVSAEDLAGKMISARRAIT